MKKVLIGCVVLLLLTAVGITAASYYAYRKVTDTVAGFTELATVPELDRTVRNRSPYAPPPSGELAPAQLERLLGVQASVRARLGDRVHEFERKYETLLAKDSATITDAPELVAAYRDLASAYVEAKRAQVAALNEAGFSLEEYRWVRGRAYAALGMPLMEVDIARIVDDLKAGRTPKTPATPVQVGPAGTPATRKLVEPHRTVLERNVGLAFFGL